MIKVHFSVILMLVVAACSGDKEARVSTEEVTSTEVAQSITTEDSAIAEGFPEQLIYKLQPISGPASFTMDQNIASKRLWNSGQTLQVCFFGGQGPVQELVAAAASEWEQSSGLKFDFGEKGSRNNCMLTRGFSHIRIGFSDRGYFSAVGRDSVTRLEDNQPSMNLQDFHIQFSPRKGYTEDNIINKASEQFKGIIRHEFGHAIGLLHEHQNRNLNCWDEIIKEGPGNVYSYYLNRHKWDRPKVERNLGYADKHDPDAESGEIDNKSIMTYVIVEEILRDGITSKCYFPTRINRISDLDKAYVSEYYSNKSSKIISDTELSSITLAVPNIASDSAANDEYLARIFADLESDDTFIRRDARVRLANEFSRNPDESRIEKVTNKLKSGTYRFQLGVAVALSAAGNSVSLTDASIADLQKIYDGSSDETLRDYIEKTLVIVD